MSLSLDFSRRHIGPDIAEEEAMLSLLGYESRQSLVDQAVPKRIRLEQEMSLPQALSEVDALASLKAVMEQNEVKKSLIGQGYYGTITPAVIQRNILENPGWYTAYTPYQSEIAQGRLEALLNFQTMVCDLTALPVSNASLLDEATAASEAMSLALSARPKGQVLFVSDACHSQTLAVLETRAEPLGIELKVGDWRTFDPSTCEGLFAAIVQYPDTLGRVDDFEAFTESVHEAKALVIAATDLLALTLLKAPGEWGADIAIGSAQRFGVPFGYGGPHAAFIACADTFKRKLPGRLVGVSVDSQGQPAYRLSLQTREQHIRRDKATSNICTAQVLLAVMASMYAVYHGPEGLREIASRVHGFATRFAHGAGARFTLVSESFFDTVTLVTGDETAAILEKLAAAGFNLRQVDDQSLALSFDETTTESDLDKLWECFGIEPSNHSESAISADLIRISQYLQHPVFQSHRSETEMLRYLKRLESKDLALNESMIPLGSCTMKLNATSEMIPLSWPEVSAIHPFVPADQVRGYHSMLQQLSEWLAEITGFAAVSLQPNAGSQGEYAGLLAIRRYHLNQDQEQRKVCLIPLSAHGTNPASAVMAGFRVVAVKCDEEGNIDLGDLKARVEEHSENLGALMITYPSTHGVFEESVTEICQLIHDHGGFVYMDGANMNAQVGLTSPGRIGADVCHLNLHKTFCIPHGGGGPGVGPIGVVDSLVPYLPGHEFLESTTAPVCAAPYGSASINVISWMYIAMMGARGLTAATEMAILNANYLAKRLGEYYPILYRGRADLVAHECIIDVRPLSEQSGVTVEDVAKRLADYGFHSPTMSWPVAGTLMIEPTESESLAELDRFCEALIAIHGEISAIVSGEVDREDNVLKNAPHSAQMVTADEWAHPYSREQAAYPLPYLRQHKFWPAVSRVDNVYGDRNLVCTCGGVDDYASVS